MTESKESVEQTETRQKPSGEAKGTQKVPKDTAQKEKKPRNGHKWMPVLIAVIGIAIGACGGIGVYTMTHQDKHERREVARRRPLRAGRQVV